MNENEFYFSDEAKTTHNTPPSPRQDCDGMESSHDLRHRTGAVHYRR